MIVIGLTGGIGTGKSTASQILSQLGAKILDADKVGHELYLPGTPVWQEIVGVFGEGILKPNREIDRGKLAQIVFNNPLALRRLNEIMHPKMYERMKEILNQWRREGVKVAVLEAAILIEANWSLLVDEIWVVIANEEKILERLCYKGFSPDEVRRRLRSQMDIKEKAKLAQVVLDNNGDIDELRRQIERQWQRLGLT